VRNYGNEGETMLSGPLSPQRGASSRCRLRKVPSDIEGSYKYVYIE